MQPQRNTPFNRNNSSKTKWGKTNNKNTFKDNRGLWIVVLIVSLITIFILFFSGDKSNYRGTTTSIAFNEIAKGNVEKAIINDKEQTLQLDLKQEVPTSNKPDARKSNKLITQYPARATEQIFSNLKEHNVYFDTVVTTPKWWMGLLSWLPFLLIFGFFIFVSSRMQGGAGGIFGFAKSRIKQLSKDDPKTKFTDVAGEDEAVEELQEIKDFLQNPSKYAALGAKIPRGVLLYGPPGTGKTLLAKAVAGEAGVPFFSISGSDFVEMFVGVGASRVRDMFEQAKQSAPCIVFVDEIDAVGRQRGAGIGGGHDEREQTLNQLLVEMDGFENRQEVIVIAATNRPDVLDPALLRPGRFDRQIPVSNPDMAGRKAILEVHAKNKPFAADVDFTGLARRTPGMSGADLANVINEAAILTARFSQSAITSEILEEAVDRVIGGPRRKNKMISELERKIAAYHESGHTLAAWATEGVDPIYKVTILARGRTGGHALAVPERDKDMLTRHEIIGRIVMAMGGRAAEELVFHDPSTGASSDIDQATKLARAMVAEYGMSSKLGAVRYVQEDGDPFLGRAGGAATHYSDEIAKEIDQEVKEIIEVAHTEAWKILQAYRETLDELASALLEKETLGQKDLEVILAGVKKRPPITKFDKYGKRTPSDKPPVQTPREKAEAAGKEYHNSNTEFKPKAKPQVTTSPTKTKPKTKPVEGTASSADSTPPTFPPTPHIDPNVDPYQN